MRVRSSRLGSVLSFRLAVAGALAFAAAMIGYAWVRAVEAMIFPQADPRAIVAVTTSGFPIRCAVALFVGGMGAFAGWSLGEAPIRGARAASIAAIAGFVALVIQAGLAP